MCLSIQPCDAVRTKHIYISQLSEAQGLGIIAMELSPMDICVRAVL